MRISKTKKRTIFHTFLLYNLSCIHFSTGPRPDGSPIPYAPQQQLFVSASKHGVVQSSNILNYNSSYTHHRRPAHAGRRHPRHPAVIRPHTHFL